MKKSDQTDQCPVCLSCGLKMAPGNGCLVSHIRHGDQYYERIKAGDKTDLFYGMTQKQRCNGCGVKKGQYHHMGCDNERCPKCRKQLFICECSLDAYLIGSTEYDFF